MSPRREKGFSLETTVQFIYYLKNVIQITDSYLIRLERYIVQLREFLDIHKMDEEPNKLIETEQLEGFFDNFNSVRSVLLNLTGDRSTNSLSYVNFRDLVKKKGNLLKLLVSELEPEIHSKLRNLTELRNASLHVPLTFLSTTWELEQKRITEELLSFQPNIFNPIINESYAYVQAYEFLVLFDSANEFFDLIRSIHQRMKKDYSQITGESVRINRVQLHCRDFEEHITINTIAFAKHFGKNYTPKEPN